MKKKLGNTTYTVTTPGIIMLSFYAGIGFWLGSLAVTGLSHLAYVAVPAALSLLGY